MANAKAKALISTSTPLRVADGGTIGRKAVAAPLVRGKPIAF
jgi:hypothetical protein